MPTHRPFVRFPDPRLKAIAAPVAGIDDQINAIWDEMLLAMYQMPGVGLAAPQLGIGLRLAVVDCSETKDQAVRLANPEISWASDELSTYREASPNLPGASEHITRPATVEIRYLNADSQWDSRRFDGLWATSVQHQIDHLDGMLFIDRLGAVRRQRLLKGLRVEKRHRQRGGR